MNEQPKTGIIKRVVITAIMITMVLGLTACGVQPDGQSQVHVAASGDDESGNGTQDAPYATISMAAKTNPGALILVHEGEYGPVELGPDCSGSELSPTIIRAADGERVVIQAEDGVGIHLENTGNISLEGLETEGGTHGITYESSREAGDNTLSQISIRNCKVHGVRGIHGINVYACNDLAPVSDLTIEGCEVYDCECGSSESVVLNGNIDGFLIANNTIHDNNNIGIDMIGFEELAKHQEENKTENPDTKNPFEVDQVRNGVCRNNIIYNISTEGNPAYFEDGEYDPCADGIYVDGGRDIEIYDNFIFNCDIGLEVATEHSPQDNELFRVTGVRVHDNVIADCHGWTGLCFGGYDKDLGFTEDCEFDHNTFVDNSCQIGVQRSRNNRIHANLILGGETAVEFSEEVNKEDMVNNIKGNVFADIEDKESWSEEYGKLFSDRNEVADGFQSLIDNIGSDFTPDADVMEIYEKEKQK